MVDLEQTPIHLGLLQHQQALVVFTQVVAVAQQHLLQAVQLLALVVQAVEVMPIGQMETQD